MLPVTVAAQSKHNIYNDKMLHESEGCFTAGLNVAENACSSFYDQSALP